MSSGPVEDVVDGDVTATAPRQSILGRLFTRKPIPHTRLQSIVLAASLTVIPLALLLSNNQGTIANRQPILQIALVALIVSAILTVVFSTKLAPHVAGALVGGFGYGFFSLSWIPERAGTPTLLLFWTATSLIGSAVLVWLLSDSKVIVTLASLASAAVVVFLVATSSTSGRDEVAGRADSVAPEALSFAEPFERTPNVYVFVLDGFGRPDVLTEQFGARGFDIDLSESVDELETLGFVQDADGSANYVQSILSIPSALNGTLHHLPDAPLSGFEIWRTGRPAVQGDNLLVNSLRAAGYEYWHSGSVIWDATACAPSIADRCLGLDTADQETISALWSNTPLRQHVGLVPFEDFSDPESTVDSILEARAQRTNDDPYVVFSHIVSPHQPYRFEQDCQLRNRTGTGTTLDNGSLPEHRPLFVNQVHCLGDQLEEAMAELVEADPDALILLQADHGTAFEINHDTLDWTDTAIRERLAIFRMTRVPDVCRRSEPEAQSLVNTPQLILSCLSGEEPEWIEPQMFLLTVEQEVFDAGAPLIFAE